jgi:nicotinate-nucleotide pyrophosphorylase (carboxylating)
MQRMSAIATKTKEYVRLLEGTKAKILDTRKTTPGFGACEKWAVKLVVVKIIGLLCIDMIMLKSQ